MKNIKKLVSICLVSTLALTSLAGCSGKAVTSGADEVVQLKLGMVDSEKSNYYKGMQKVAEEVDKATNGKVKITVYPSSQLGNERDMYEGAQLGSIDMVSIANPVLSSFIPDMAVLDQPFLFDTADQAHKVIDGTLGDKIAEKALVQGVHILGWMESGFRNVFSSRPVQSPEDFKGLKIRTMENDLHIAAFNSLGAIATPMAAGDVFTGLQQKTIDAAENATANVLANNYYEITPNITRSQHAFVFIAIGISDKAWNKIPKDLQSAFTEAVQKGCVAQRQYLVDANTEAEKALVEKGVKFYDIDREVLKTKVLAAMEQHKSKMNAEWMAIIESEKN